MSSGTDGDRLTTPVLDTATGQPAALMQFYLSRQLNFLAVQPGQNKQ